MYSDIPDIDANTFVRLYNAMYSGKADEKQVLMVLKHHWGIHFGFDKMDDHDRNKLWNALYPGKDDVIKVLMNTPIDQYISEAEVIALCKNSL